MQCGGFHGVADVTGYANLRTEAQNEEETERKGEPQFTDEEKQKSMITTLKRSMLSTNN